MAGETLYRATGGSELTFAYDFDAFIAIEDAAERRFQDVLDDLKAESPRLKDLRALIYGGLRRHHPDITLTDVGELVLSEGKELGAAMYRALSAAMPKPKGGGKSGANPRKAAPKAPRRGTGTRSSRPGARKG